jgi:Putative Flp pilus-assembly TadE/G-like
MRALFTRAAGDFLRRFRNGSGGNIAIMSAIVLPVVLGFFGLGTEGAAWFLTNRSEQNAADSAAIAAASNAGADYAAEAKAVAAQYGYADGKNGVTVTALGGQPCPDGSSNCYSVMVSKPVPLMLAQVVGYRGDATVGGAPAKTIRASALAIQGLSPRPYCVLALASSGASPALRTNGAPKANLAGCNVMSNTAADCNGHNLGADVGDAHDTNSGCGVKENSNVPTLPDPYAALVNSVPPNTCDPSSYWQEPAKKGPGTPPPGNQLAGLLPWSGYVQKCGDVVLMGPTVIDTDSNGAVLVIENGQLDTNGFMLQTSGGSALTIIFSGTSGAYTHAPTGGGTLDIAAPTTGPWSGVAIYQDPRLSQGMDISAAGNSPTWNITGLVYLPHSSVTFSGAVNKASNGLSCFVLIVDSLLINGTGDILPKGQCVKAGVSMPTSPLPSRGKLVS